MQRYANEIKGSVDQINQQVRSGNTNAVSDLPQQVYDLLDTIEGNLDMLCQFSQPLAKINAHESSLYNLQHDFQRLGAVVRSVAEAHNELAKEVDKLKKIFSFLMENKKTKVEDLDKVLKGE